MTALVDSTMKIYNSPSYIPLLNNYEQDDMTDDVYSFVGHQNIYFLNTFFGKDKKIKKGKRKHTLFYQALVLKNIEPSLRTEDMAANLLWMLYHHYEEPKDINPYEIVKIAQNALKSEADSANCGKKKYLIDNDCKSLTKPEKSKYLGQAMKKKRDNDVLPNYDFNLSVSKNAILLGKSVGTIYNSLKDNDVNYKDDKEYLNFKELYFVTAIENRSVRKMAMISSLNRGKSERYIKKINSE